MSYHLSLLDKSPIPEGATAAQALLQTLLRARRADALGYHRYWIAEHHGNPRLASSAPELLVAHILAQTRRIRVGSGGVMLQHYAPFKVAESFRLLAALAPGRVDLGVGKAPGGLPQGTRALHWLHDAEHAHDFASQFALLDAFLHDRVDPRHALAGARAYPEPPQLPERFLLGGSPDSALLAARHGWQFCHAGHFNGDPAVIARSVAAYREAAGRPPALALYALAAPTREDAQRQAGALRAVRLHLSTGQTVNLPSEEAAAEFARQAGVTRYRTEETRPQVIAGTAAEVREALDALHARYGVGEFVIDSPVADFAERLQSLELLATTFEPIEA